MTIRRMGLDSLALVLVAAAGVGLSGCSDGGSSAGKAPPAQVKGPAQGSSFSEPAKKAPAPAAVVAGAESGGTTGSIAAPASVGSGAGSAAVTASAVPQPVPGSESVAGGIPSPPAPSPVVALAAVAKTPDAAAPAGTIEKLPFDVLTSFKYTEPKPSLGQKPGSPPPTPVPNQIPETVKAWDGKQIEIDGYMVPMDVTDDGKVKTFILSKLQPQCCFGDVQAITEWIDVKMDEGQTAEFMLDRPVKVKGKLEVGEKLEDGYLVSLYRMQASEVSD